ncbi:winged helix-turn-helix transcriptional regulator [Hamadaea tsunoensis]|uniref:winged helix-turn-helix transcriptional regulator n=1 Tax=Hamadaea tsunoensis TaxID=53368 RepID=UPI0006870A92|nr:helix-turn-helix domain-containing protein [Hamadaea tsunoensis]
MVARAYDEGCAATHALDLVGERWALLIVRELLFGPKRFTDLDGRLAGASTSVLSQRLQELAAAGVLTRRKLPPPAGSWVYELTDWGRELEPIIMGLGRWGIQSPRFDCEAPVTPASMALALKGFAPSARVEKLAGLVELELDGEVFHAFVQDGRLRVTAATGRHPDARIIASPGRLWPFLRGLAATPGNLRNNGIRTEGDEATAVALLVAVGS